MRVFVLYFLVEISYFLKVCASTHALSQKLRNRDLRCATQYKLCNRSSESGAHFLHSFFGSVPGFFVKIDYLILLYCVIFQSICMSFASAMEEIFVIDIRLRLDLTRMLFSYVFVFVRFVGRSLLEFTKPSKLWRCVIMSLQCAKEKGMGRVHQTT